MHFCETTVIGHARGSGFRKAVQFLREYPPPVGTNKTREELSLACQTGHFEEKIENDMMLSPKLRIRFFLFHENLLLFHQDQWLNNS